MNAVHWGNHDFGVVVGDGGEIRTTENLHGLDLVHESYGCAVGDNGTIVCWEGSSWTPEVVPGLPPGAGPEGVTVHLLDENGDSGVTDADGRPVDDVLTDATGYYAFPNPFNPATSFHFELPAGSPVYLGVFNPAGRCVARLLNGEEFAAGRHDLVWRGEDDDGRRLASGIYIFRLRAGGSVWQGKLTMLK